MARQCKNWMDTYLLYTHTQESPEDFHVWMSIGIISATLGSNIIIERGFYVLYPNLYIVLTSASAWSRRSTALGVGTNLLTALEKPPSIISQKITPEALIGALKRIGHETGLSVGVVVASEMSVFLGQCKTDPSLLGILCDFFDGRRKTDVWSYETRRLGVETLTAPLITILASSTPDLIRNSLPASAVGSGFTGRLIFVHADRTDRFNPFPEITDKERKLKSMLMHDLNVIRNLTGEVTMTPNAREWFTDWYQILVDEEIEPQLVPYYGRKHDILIKVATILSVMEGDSLVIDTKHFEEGLKMLNYTEKFTLDVLSQIGMTDVGEVGQLVLNIIGRRSLDGISHADLLRKVSYKISAVELQNVLTTLSESGQIIESVENRKRLYKIIKRRR